MKKRIVRQVDYLQELNRDARSTEHKLYNSSVLTTTARRMELLFYALKYKLHELVQFLGPFRKIAKSDY